MLLNCNSKFENILNNKNISDFKKYAHLFTLDQTMYIPSKPGNPRFECRKIGEKGNKLDSRQIAKPSNIAVLVEYTPTLRKVQQKICNRVNQIKNEQKNVYIYVLYDSYSIRKSYILNPVSYTHLTLPTTPYV